MKELSNDIHRTSSPTLLQRGFERTHSHGQDLNVISHFPTNKGIFGSLIISKQKINQYSVCLDGHLKQRGDVMLYPNTYVSKILQEIIPKVTRAELKLVILAWNDGQVR